MRRFVIAVTTILLAGGCRNQSSSLSNPFLAPDRVPPPATRVVAPGTAQPYYPNPGGVAPGPTATGSPYGQPPATSLQGYPSGGTTPAPALPSNSQPPAYNQPYGAGYQGASLNNPNLKSAPFDSVDPRQDRSSAAMVASSGDSIRVPTDVSSLRFNLPPASAAFATEARQTFSTQAQSTQTALSNPSYQAQPPSVSLAEASLRMPIQNMLPQSSHGEAARLSQEPAAIQQASFSSQQPGAGQSNFQRVSMRELSTSELQASRRSPGQNAPGVQWASHTEGSGGAPSKFSTSDAFARKTPLIPNLPAQESDDRFGAAPDHTWLRGRVEHSPTSGQWMIRFSPGGSPSAPLNGLAVVENPRVLGGLQPGEFVVVRGNWQNRPAHSGGAIPTYRVSVVQRQQL